MSIQHSMQRSHQFYLLYYVQDDSLPSFSNREVYEVQLLLLVYRYGTFIGLFVCRQDNWKSWMDKDHNFRVDKPPAKVGSTPPPTQEESHWWDQIVDLCISVQPYHKCGMIKHLGWDGFLGLTMAVSLMAVRTSVEQWEIQADNQQTDWRCLLVEKFQRHQIAYLAVDWLIVNSWQCDSRVWMVILT